MASTENGNDKLRGYTLRLFVDDPPQLFKCEICKLVLRDPQITRCCGRNACRACIAGTVEENGPCPIHGCPEPCVKISFNRNLSYNILNQVVYCNCKDTGCRWVDKLESLDKHLEVCPFVEEDCRYFCGMRIQRQLTKDHEFTVCEHIPVKCDKCGELYERRHKSSHVKVCSYTKTECPFNIVGCTRVMMNKDVQQHLEESLPEHYALVAKQSEAIQAKINENKVIAQVKDKLVPQTVAVATLRDEITTAKLEVSALQQALTQVENEYEELHRRHKEIAVEIAQITAENDVALFSLSEARDRTELDAKVRIFGQALPRLLPSDITSRPANSLRTTEEYIPRVCFTIKSFVKERKNDSVVYLPPFYSHKYGYKLCISVYCNGYGQFKGESLVILATNLKGDYDNLLNWPVKFKITIEIISLARGVKNYSKVLIVKSPSRALTNNFSWMKSEDSLQICALSSIMSPQNRFLSDGCLKIVIASVTLMN